MSGVTLPGYSGSSSSIMTQPQIIVASNSPRRRELLQEAGYEFTVVPPCEDVECGVCSESGPTGLVAELAYRKAAAVRHQLVVNPQSEGTARRVVRNPKSIILAADTVAECDGFILGKPRDEAEARAMLTRLSGREHRVLTGVCLWPIDLAPPEEDQPSKLPLPPGEGRDEGGFLVRVALTKLRMDQLSEQQINEYLDSGRWQGKAGGFGYQDRLGWVHIVQGSETNVVGLPMELLAEMLDEFGAGSREQGAGSTE